MSTPATTPNPAFGNTGTPPSRPVLWKASLAVTAIMLVFLMWQCGSTIVQGQKLADTAVRHFHEQLNAENYENISREADEGFRAGQSREQLTNFLGAVHKKLGNANREKQLSIRIETNARGIFETTWYRTTFDNGTANERFTWVKNGSALKLYEYHIESNALLSN